MKRISENQALCHLTQKELTMYWREKAKLAELKNKFYLRRITRLEALCFKKKK